MDRGPETRGVSARHTRNRGPACAQTRGGAGAGLATGASGSTGHTGMTLLELLLALAIFSIVGAAIYSTFTSTLAGRDRAVARAQAYSAARGVLDRIESDLRSSLDAGIKGSLLPRFVAPGSGLGLGSGRRTGFGDERLLLDLTTLSARGVTAPEGYVADDEGGAKSIDRGDLARVVWRVEEAEAGSASGPLLVRYEIKPPRNEELDLARAARQVVAEQVSVRLDFFAQDGWYDLWDSVAPGPHRGLAPALVRTTVELRGADEEAIVLVSATVLPLADEKPSWARAGAGRLPKDERETRKGDGRSD